MPNLGPSKRASDLPIPARQPVGLASDSPHKNFCVRSDACAGKLPTNTGLSRLVSIQVRSSPWTVEDPARNGKKQDCIGILGGTRRSRLAHESPLVLPDL